VGGGSSASVGVRQRPDGADLERDTYRTDMDR